MSGTRALRVRCEAARSLYKECRWLKTQATVYHFHKRERSGVRLDATSLVVLFTM